MVGGDPLYLKFRLKLTALVQNRRFSVYFRLTGIRLTNSMTISGEKYLTAIVVIIVYIEDVGALIATLCKFAWWNCPRKG